MLFANVAIATPVKQLFTYKVLEGMELSAGSRVSVPFGNRTAVGFVIGVSPTAAKSHEKNNFEIKAISKVLDAEPVFSASMLELIKWMAGYYCVGIGEMCKSALPSMLVKSGKKGHATPRKEADSLDDFAAPLDLKLTKEQQGAFDSLISKVGNGFSTSLIHGVTGSGKTELYMRLCAEVLGKGEQAIFLVPEIGMTPQAVGRVVSRFGANVAVYHSDLTDARKLYEWRRMQSGEASIVIGTRSAIFAPFKKTGIIIVDEEHDSSYKQDENPRYNGRDIAITRASIEKIPCVLGSATPSIESFANAGSKKYFYVRLTERPTKSPMPDIEVVDMRGVHKSTNLSPRLIGAISDSLSKKEQTMLFLNRRGFSNVVLCADCGFVAKCPNCNITLAYHKRDASLMCHYCDYLVGMIKQCVECKGTNLLNLGTGTERVESEIASYFPDARVARFDRDTTSKAGERTKILTKMKNGEIDILVGTQMITKGHDFPNVTLVGVLDADLSLNFPDFRAPERTFQLITQVAGRSGRADRAGKVIVQTYSPDHFAVSASTTGDIDKFYADELSSREELGYPPFGRLALLKFSGAKEALVEKTATEVALHLQKMADLSGGVLVLGPSVSPVSKIRNNYRWQILLKSRGLKGLKPLLEAASFGIKPPKGVKLSIDVDPQNML